MLLVLTGGLVLAAARRRRVQPAQLVRRLCSLRVKQLGGTPELHQDLGANEALVRLLAYTLRCGLNRVEIVRGAASSRKTLMLHGFTEQEVAQAIGERARRA